MFDTAIGPTTNMKPGGCLNIKTVFPMYGDSHVKDMTVGEAVLSFNMGIPILVRRHIYIEAAPWWLLAAWANWEQ